MKTSPLPRPANWFLLFILLLSLGGLLRLIDITDEPLDFQPSRQLRNSLVAREIYYSVLPSATDEQRQLSKSFADSVGKYEPPVIESIVAYSYFLTGGENIAVARVWVTLFWLMAGIALFDLMKRAVSPWSALIALSFYLVLPFSVQASRSFQPDPLMTSAFVIGIYFLYRWSEESSPLLRRRGVRGEVMEICPPRRYLSRFSNFRQNRHRFFCSDISHCACIIHAWERFL
ncbi:MAG: hypothetical protein UZ14_CFX002001785 [Chloroflexi bacterium OLB14]|nr:MAG: hypothetical protein UZ14_CFX002001785 [Chloroflexi bacterium OLB14]